MERLFCVLSSEERPYLIHPPIIAIEPTDREIFHSFEKKCQHDREKDVVIPTETVVHLGRVPGALLHGFVARETGRVDRREIHFGVVEIYVLVIQQTPEKGGAQKKEPDPTARELNIVVEPCKKRGRQPPSCAARQKNGTQKKPDKTGARDDVDDQREYRDRHRFPMLALRQTNHLAQQCDCAEGVLENGTLWIKSDIVTLGESLNDINLEGQSEFTANYPPTQPAVFGPRMRTHENQSDDLLLIAFDDIQGRMQSLRFPWLENHHMINPATKQNRGHLDRRENGRRKYLG